MINVKIISPKYENRPDGYPKYDPKHPFWKAAHKVLEERKEDIEKAKAFLKKLRTFKSTE